MKLDGIVYSTGNPTEELHFQFTDSKNGFIYGNEMGYGYWPFLFKTSDGGRHWNRILFKEVQSGTELFKDHFYMFDKQRGILIHNVDNVKRKLGKEIKYFQYYLTNDGGSTWTKRTFRLKQAKGLRIENNPYFMNCSFNNKGEVEVQILRPPWAVAEGKRKVKDRLSLLLKSEDFGKNFKETVPE